MKVVADANDIFTRRRLNLIDDLPNALDVCFPDRRAILFDRS
jgi:hypothetical protein